MYEWTPNQSNIATFVLVDDSGDEVAGLGSAFTVKVGNGSGTMATSDCTKGEIAGGVGWYWALFPADECPRAVIPIQVTHASVKQQNLVALCGKNLSPLSIQHTLTILHEGDPVGDVTVWVSTDANGANVVASGITDSFGHVTFLLDPGTYYSFKRKYGLNFVNPESFLVS